MQVAELGPEQFFGEMSLLDNKPRSATVTASTRLRAFSIASFSFRPLLAEHFEMADKVILRLCQRLRDVEQALAT